MAVFQTKLDDDVVRMMGPGFAELHPAGRINSLDFHRTREVLVTSAEDQFIRVYNTATGQLEKSIASHKYGASCVRWTHSEYAVVHASTKASTPGQSAYDLHAVRYLDLHKSHFNRYFRGHTKEVIHLDMSPKNDTFLTSSTDRSVRLWDLRTNICQAKLDTPAAAPCASFDQQALIFGVALEGGTIKLYDVRNYTAGPFQTISVPQLVNSPSNFAQLQFSMDGQKLLAVCDGNIFVLDAFNGNFLSSMNNGVPESGAPRQACFSCDSNYILSGGADKSIKIWSAASGAEVASWHGHVASPTCIAWAPQRVLVASAGNDLMMWIPDMQKLQQHQQHQQQGQQPAAAAAAAAAVYQQQMPMQHVAPGQPVVMQQQQRGYAQQYQDPGAGYAYR